MAYLLGRQHIPNRRVAEAMADLFGLEISTGAVDSIYAEAGRRLKGFIVALVALLKEPPRAARGRDERPGRDDELLDARRVEQALHLGPRLGDER